MHRNNLAFMKNLLLNRTVHILSMALAIIVCVANGQQNPTQSRQAANKPIQTATQRAISRLESGNFAPFDIEVIAESNAAQAIPALETQFERSKDLTIKGKIANALVRLGDKNSLYWDFLVNRVLQVLQDEPPTGITYDTSGKVIPAPSMKLAKWAKKHHMSIQQAWNDATFEAVAAIINLGSSDDKRSVPILRQALASQNDFVKMAAARGLAELRDTASIPLIIDACENSPKDAAAGIAESLAYFDDPTAQHALDEYVPKNTARNLREAIAHGKRPYR